MDISTILQYVLPVATLAGGWLGGRRKGKAETSKIEGNALGIMQETYTQLVSDMQDRYISLQKEIDALQLLNKNLTKSLRALKKEVSFLIEENEKLKNGN